MAVEISQDLSYEQRADILMQANDRPSQLSSFPHSHELVEAWMSSQLSNRELTTSINDRIMQLLSCGLRSKKMGTSFEILRLQQVKAVVQYCDKLEVSTETAKRSMVDNLDSIVGPTAGLAR